MATRFYLPSTGTPPVGLPGLPSGWTAGDVPEIELPGPTTKSNTALTNYTVGETTASVTNIPIAAFISAPLTAQTISGTFSAVVRGLESNAGADDSLQVGIVLIDNLGTTIKSTLYGGHAAALNTTAGALGQEFLTSAATRIFNAVALTSQTAVLGDRLAIVVGYRTHDTVTTNRNTTLRFGDPTATADFALTAGLTTDLCPWVEFSANLSFQLTTPVSDSWSTSWNIKSNVSDSWQTSWHVASTVSDSWQTSWHDYITWDAVSTTTWASHSTETWGTIAPAISTTPVSDTWSTSWNVRTSVTDSWQTSWDVRANISDAWQTSWNVRASISDSWQTNWHVLAGVSDIWQTSWGIRANISDTWQTSWNVRSSISDTWQTSWHIRANISDSWQAIWNLGGPVFDSWSTSWNVRVNVSDSWQTSWNLLTFVGPKSWSTAWHVIGQIVKEWQTIWHAAGRTPYLKQDNPVTNYVELDNLEFDLDLVTPSPTVYVPLYSDSQAYAEVPDPSSTVWTEV
ncbi:MAG TPA: hypothetical protein VFK94_06955 [Patescibacteria group bacterium]|nr:hypothetical protein [Patescibacteria group bacterium]